jgi:hypothetical protein
MPVLPRAQKMEAGELRCNASADAPARTDPGPSRRRREGRRRPKNTADHSGCRENGAGHFLTTARGAARRSCCTTGCGRSGLAAGSGRVPPRPDGAGRPATTQFFSITSSPRSTSSDDQRNAVSSPRRAPVVSASQRNTPNSTSSVDAVFSSAATFAGAGGGARRRPSAGGCAKAARFFSIHPQETAQFMAPEMIAWIRRTVADLASGRRSCGRRGSSPGPDPCPRGNVDNDGTAYGLVTALAGRATPHGRGRRGPPPHSLMTTATFPALLLPARV